MSDAQLDRAVQQAAQPRVTLVIVLKADGTMDLSGPIENKPLCYQMLVRAAVAIADHHPEQPRIAVPNLVPPRNMRQS